MDKRVHGGVKAAHGLESFKKIVSSHLCSSMSYPVALEQEAKTRKIPILCAVEQCNGSKRSTSEALRMKSSCQ